MLKYYHLYYAFLDFYRVPSDENYETLLKMLRAYMVQSRPFMTKENQ